MIAKMLEAVQHQFLLGVLGMECPRHHLTVVGESGRYAHAVRWHIDKFRQRICNVRRMQLTTHCLTAHPA